MPLQTPTTLAAAQITEAAINTRSHLTAAAGHLNSIDSTILPMPNEKLADFGNFLGQEEMDRLTASQTAQGDGLNALIGGLNGLLALYGIAPVSAAVDTRPLAEKLAEQRREIVLVDGAFSVVDFPVEVEPEPAPEP